MTPTTNKTAPATTPAKTTEQDKPLRTKHLASRFGLKATVLRRILRSMQEYADGVHTNYRWAENDPAIARIKSRIDAIAADKKAKAEAAKADLAKATPAPAK